MSVVVYKDGAMASDSQQTSGGTKSFNDKIFLLQDGRVAVGFVGDYTLGLRFVEWIKSGRLDALRPRFTEKESDKFAAIVMHSNRMVELWTDDTIPEVFTYPWAIGTGADFALAAMRLGADPAKAVDIACQFNVFCGGPVRVVEIINDRIVERVSNSSNENGGGNPEGGSNNKPGGVVEVAPPVSVSWVVGRDRGI